VKVHPRGDIVTEGGEADGGANEFVESGRVSDRLRGEGDDEAGGEIPLPWNTIDEDDEADDARPEAFEDLRFVGPRTAEALESSSIALSDVVRKRVSYRDLKDAGVNPGVAAKIRREHSLSWSFDATDSDLSRRSTQVRGLDDGERAWIAASSAGRGGSDGAAARTTTADDAEADGSGDGVAAESAWRERSPGAGGAPGDVDATADEEAAWRAESKRASEGTGGPTDEEAAWRAKSVGSVASGNATDAEAAWRAQSAPTPVTALDDVDEEDARELADAGIRSVRRLATADPESVADALRMDPTLVEAWVRDAAARLDDV
jgi:hypothetical protein